MEAEHSEKRKEPRLAIHAETTILRGRDGQTASATTVDMSASGVLLHFKEPVHLAPGDRVTCDFIVSHDPDKPLPYWGMGSIVRVNGCDVAIDLKATGLSPLEP
jgi:hypothetical protein